MLTKMKQLKEIALYLKYICLIHDDSSHRLRCETCPSSTHLSHVYNIHSTLFSKYEYY